MILVAAFAEQKRPATRVTWLFLEPRKRQQSVEYLALRVEDQLGVGPSWDSCLEQVQRFELLQAVAFLQVENTFDLLYHYSDIFGFFILNEMQNALLQLVINRQVSTGTACLIYEPSDVLNCGLTILCVLRIRCWQCSRGCDSERLRLLWGSLLVSTVLLLVSSNQSRRHFRNF